MFDEFKEIKYFKSYNNVKYFKEIKHLRSLQKERTYFEPKRASMMKIFWWIYSKAYYFRDKISIIDVKLGYAWVSENTEIFKKKLRWSKSSRLFQFK